MSATDNLSSTNPKPNGVDLLVILTMTGGIVDLLAAAILLVVAPVSLYWLRTLVGLGIGRLVFVILLAFSVGLSLYAVTSFFLAYGLWKGRGWAWTWALSSAIIGFATSIIAMSAGIGIIGVASNALAIYYLTRTEVKTFFGKASLPQSFNIPTFRAAYLGLRFCTCCGKRFSGDEVFCHNCGARR